MVLILSYCCYFQTDVSGRRVRHYLPDPVLISKFFRRRQIRTMCSHIDI